MELKPKYNVELIEEDGKHFYTAGMGSAVFPGVTTVIGRVLSKYILRPWAVKVTGNYYHNYLCKVSDALTGVNVDKLIDRTLSRKQLWRLLKRAKRQWKYEGKKAAEIGTRAHEFYDQHYASDKRQDTEDSEIKMAVDNFYDWRGKTSIKIVSGDLKIASLLYRFGGSLDAFGTIGNSDKLVIVDYKTSNYVGVDYAYQIAAYSIAAKETFGLAYFPEGFCIRFDKNKLAWEERRIKNMKKAREGFLHIHEIYKQIDLEPFEITIQIK